MNLIEMQRALHSVSYVPISVQSYDYISTNIQLGRSDFTRLVAGDTYSARLMRIFPPHAMATPMRDDVGTAASPITKSVWVLGRTQRVWKRTMTSRTQKKGLVVDVKS